MVYENILVGRNIAYAERVTTYIASWALAGGKLETILDQKDFRKWLESRSEDLDDEIIDYIVDIATSDAIWLTVSATDFIRNQNAKREKYRERNKKRNEKMNNN